VDLRIGANGYYCYSSYKQRPDSIYLFAGELRKYDCSPCPSSFKLILSDTRKRAPGAAVNVDSAFRTGVRKLVPLMAMTPVLKLSGISNQQVTNINWQLSDGRTFTGPTILADLLQTGAQSFSMTVRTAALCESQVTNTVHVDENGNVFACSVQSTTLTNNGIHFTSAISGGRPPFQQMWVFGDGYSTTTAYPIHNYLYAGSYPVRLRVTDADHRVCESTYIVVAGNDVSSCSAGIKTTYHSSQNALLDGMILQWTDKNNVVYRTDRVAQDAGSYCAIVKSEPYEANERGETGRLLTVRFNVLMSDGTRTIRFKSDNAAIAVTYN